MTIQELIDKQYLFDKDHGWTLEEQGIDKLLDMMNKDLIGLFGEIGEVANLVKKMNLLIESSIDKSDKEQEENIERIKEELIDSLIYLLRMSKYLKIDIELEYEKKMEKNNEKYQRFEC